MGYVGRVPAEFEHAGLVPEPLESEWQFECEQVCDVKHWRAEMDNGVTDDAEDVKVTVQKLANPLPQEEVKVTDK